jgi:hypothetical protein
VATQPEFERFPTNNEGFINRGFIIFGSRRRRALIGMPWKPDPGPDMHRLGLAMAGFKCRSPWRRE